MYSFRRATGADQEKVYEILKENMQSYFDGFTSEGWSRDKFLASFKPSDIIICEEECRIIGFYEARLKEGCVYVANVQMRRGERPMLAAILERIEIEARASGIGKLVAKVFKANPALRLAFRHGFVVSGEITGEHSYWVEKSLAR